ncbi:MAG: hypothetical protein AAGU74_01780 [Bacillota bacterium]
MLKRIGILCVCLMLAFSFGCGASPSKGPSSSEEPAATPGTGLSLDPSAGLLGMIVEDDGKLSTYMQMHGFLRTAENLGYAARVFRYQGSAGAADAYKQASDAGCTALLFYDPLSKGAEAIGQAVQSGKIVAVSYYACAVEGVNINVVADSTAYLEEMARGIAERMSERKLKTGRILVYGFETADANEGFSKALLAYYPQYTSVAFTRTSQEEQAAVDELAAFILENRDIKGMFCVDDTSTSVAVKARSKAQSLFKGASATPSPKATVKPTPTPSSAGTPSVSVAPSTTPIPEALLAQILITMFGTGINKTNIELMKANDVYGLVLEPHYESAAQCTLMMDALMRGESVAKTTVLNIPIVRQDTMDKYVAVYEQVQDLFDLSDGE